MTAREAIETLKTAGGSIRLDGESLKVKLPPQYPEAEPLLAELRARKLEVIAALRSGSMAACGSGACAGCYSIGAVDGRERFIHPPKASAEWEEWLRKWQPKGKAQ